MSDVLYDGTNCVLSVTVCEIITSNIPKLSPFESLALKMKVKVMGYNVAEYVVG